MSYEFLSDVATADLAFVAKGKTVEELFTSAAEALFAIMVDLKGVEPKQKIQITLRNVKLDQLLYDFLSELVYYKDANAMLFAKFALSISNMPNVITKQNGAWQLRCDAYGEPIDPQKHELIDDVKAVTLHRFSLLEKAGQYEAQVTVDL